MRSANIDGHQEDIKIHDILAAVLLGFPAKPPLDFFVPVLRECGEEMSRHALYFASFGFLPLGNKVDVKVDKVIVEPFARPELAEIMTSDVDAILGTELVILLSDRLLEKRLRTLSLSRFERRYSEAVGSSFLLTVKVM